MSPAMCCASVPQVSGKVVAVDVDDNDMVAAGQTLVRP